MAIKSLSKKNKAGALRSVPALDSEGFLLSLIGVTVVAGVMLFILWPVLSVLFKSLSVDGHLSLNRYTSISGETGLLKNSVVVASLCSVFSTLLGFAIALYLSHSSGRFKKLVRLTLLLTLISPPFLSSLAYIMLFGRRGLITWKILGIQWNPYGLHGIVLIESLGLATMSAFLILAVLQGVDRSLELASLDLGVSRGRTFWSITFPLSRMGIVTAALIVFIRSLSDFGTPMIIGGNYSVLATEAYLTAVGSYDLPKAAAMCTLLLIPALSVFMVYRSILEGKRIFTGRTQSVGDNTGTLPLWLERFVTLLTWAFVLFEGVKYGAILAGSFVTTWGVNFQPTLKHLSLLKISKLDSLLRSIRYSFTAAIFVAFLGPISAWFLRDMKKGYSRFVDFVIDLPFILPGTFFGLGYLLAFNWMPNWLLSSGFLVVANCAYRQLTIGVRSGASVLGQLNPETENAIRDLGGNRLCSLKDLIFPQLHSAFLIGFINTFTASMTTIGAIIFLVTPYTKVATVEMFDSVQNGRIGEACSMATIIVLTVLVVNLSFLVFTRRSGKESGKGGHDFVSLPRQP